MRAEASCALGDWLTSRPSQGVVVHWYCRVIGLHRIVWFSSQSDTVCVRVHVCASHSAIATGNKGAHEGDVLQLRHTLASS